MNDQFGGDTHFRSINRPIQISALDILITHFKTSSEVAFIAAVMAAFNDFE